nr:hypothetical protein [Evansella caseinilytica]
MRKTKAGGKTSFELRRYGKKDEIGRKTIRIDGKNPNFGGKNVKIDGKTSFELRRYGKKD